MGRARGLAGDARLPSLLPEMRRYFFVSKTAVIAALALALLPIAPAHAGPAALPARAEPTGQELEAKVLAAGERLEKVIEDYNDVRENLRATRREAAALAGRMRPMERQMEARQARIGALAATAYRNGGASTALAMISAGSAGEFADRLLVLDRLAGEQREAITTLATARDRLDTARRTLDALAAQQTAQERTLAGRKKQIENDIVQLERMREQSGYAPARSAFRGFVPRFAPGQAGVAVRFAYAQLGKDYLFGGEGPDAYDCSGLTSAAWARAGVALPHNARRQWYAVSRISRAELRPGDLIFYYPSVRHVAIYVGGGKMIHAPQHGEPVRIDEIDYQPIHGYGRPA
jgi:cell wall-associated NlpC family hydrolase